MVDGPAVVLIVAVLSIGLIKILRGPVGEAFASRVRGPVVSTPDADTLAEVEALKMRLAEVEERLDFAERLLARVDTADQLPGRMER